MRFPILPLALLTAAPLAGLAAQEPRPLGAPTDVTPCGATLLEEAGADWLTDAPVRADFTLDGHEDAVVWGDEDGRLVLLIERCAAGVPLQRWRFPLEPGSACDAAAVTVTAGSLLLDDEAVERVCAVGAGRDECIHLRRENARRQALMDAGGREIRVAGPMCRATGIAWDAERGGFMVIPRR